MGVAEMAAADRAAADRAAAHDAPLIIINSGAYVVDELAAEFGLLPPAFIPVGVSPLYELQARMVADFGGDIVLTLPESFAVSQWDAERLRDLGIAVVTTADDQSLGAAILSVLGNLGFPDRPLRLLHGDTLLRGQDGTLDDVIAIAEGGDGYNWSFAELDEDGAIVRIRRSHEDRESGSLRICGYFAFSSARRFSAALATARADFIDALNTLVAQRELQACIPDQWLDFGHVQTFFQSRRIVTTQRAFNTLEIGRTYVRKSSSAAANKLRNEARWLKEVPSSLQPFCARVIDCGEMPDGYFYSTEYEYLATLAELFLFGRLNQVSWCRILASCADFINVSVASAPAGGTSGYLRELVSSKTMARLQEFAASADIDLSAPLTINGKAVPSLSQMVARIDDVLAGSNDVPSIMHGDFCFSNIMYSFRTERIRLIDPRATTQGGEFSLLGDARYDLAKLMHSIAGGYDLIIAGQYVARRESRHAFHLALAEHPSRTALTAIVNETKMASIRLTSPEVWACMVSLFLSMPPLHSDRPERQTAFLANSLRLFTEMDQLS